MRRTLVGLTLTVILSTPALAFRHLSPGQQVTGVSVTQFSGAALEVASDAKEATLLVFWATWSPRSSKALADFQELHKRYEREGLRVVGINVEHDSPSNTEIAAAQALPEALGVTYPLAVDRTLSLYAQWGVVAVPSAVLVDKAGRVLETLDGYAPTMSSLFLKRVQEVLEGTTKETAAAEHAQTQTGTALASRVEAVAPGQLR